MSAVRLALRSVPRVSTRALSVAPRTAVALRAAVPVRALTTTMALRSAGQTDEDLSASLQQEINYEAEANESAAAGEPEWLAQFRSEGVWRIEDKNGSDEIALTREFGNEHIRVLFSIGEIDTTDPTSELEQEDAEQMSGEDDEFQGSFPVRCAINITKAGRGSLNIDAQAQDGQFMVENVTFYKDDKLATDLTAEADWVRRGLYIGPQFETLDENVQTQFEGFLAERGISTNLALFIPNYAEYKEQREYCAWLENVKQFIDA